jgi:hypothetical protein
LTAASSSAANEKSPVAIGRRAFSFIADVIPLPPGYDTPLEKIQFIISKNQIRIPN